MNKSRAKIKPSRVTLTIVGLLLSMIVLYLYFLNMSVVQVVMRTEHVQKQNALNAEIATLESAFIESQHIISSRIALLDNYTTDTAKIFVSREQASLVLGSN